MALPMVIGCEEFPKGQQGLIIVSDLDHFINDQYGYDSSTLVEAFNMAATYKLYLDNKRVDPSTFGKYLSRASVGKILTAYKEFKRGEKARPTQYLGLPEVEKKPVTPKESWELVKKWYLEDGKPPFCAPYLGAYDYLLQMGKIKPVNNELRSSRTDKESTLKQRTVERYLTKL